MSLESTLVDINARLRQGKFPNEQAISQGIVLRIFQELGWDTWDTNTVWPEYQTGEGRVDFALCYPPSKPAIFTEVKQPGKAEDAVRQALEYAFHSGVPFVVLTDGRTWSFYLPAEQGSYEDRRVYKLDLYERPTNEAAEALKRYLAFENVQSGECLEIARKEYRSRNRQFQAKAAIPNAWRELVEKGDETLVEILTSAVESRAGIRPNPDDVTEFLEGLGKTNSLGAIPVRTIQLQPKTIATPNNPVIQQTKILPQTQAITQPSTNEVSRGGTLTLLGKSFNYHNAKDAMITILSKLAEADPQFLERCSQHPDAQGRKRRYIARNTEELYPDREDLRDLYETLPGGWLITTNLNNRLKMTVIRLATEVAGLKFGKDVNVDL